MIHIKCDLSFCDKCPKYNSNDKELDDGPNASIIYSSVYDYQVRCETCGIIANGTNVCRICEENDDMKNFLIKRPTYVTIIYRVIIQWWSANTING